MANNILYIVVPCYNEEQVLPDTSKTLESILKDLISKNKISDDSRIFFLNDGSKDKTWEIIRDLHKTSKYFSGATLSRNRGHQNALLGGLSEAVKKADLMITIDADLQDDPVCIEMMVDKYLEGYEVVNGVRSDRKSDTFFKRVTAQAYYKIMRFMGIDLIYNCGDCRLLSKRAAQALLNFREVNLFLRGLVPLIGYKSTTVEYKRNERMAGESKYGLKQMFALAGQGITSFSLKPINLIRSFGIFLILGGIISAICCGVLVPHQLYGVLIPVIFIAVGILNISIYIVGLYVGKTYVEVKDRPKFIIAETLEK